MSTLLRQTVRATLLLAVVMVGGAATPAADKNAGESPSAAARGNPEVRLRKLHLVRPDLLPYPLAYDVYC